MTKLNFPTRYPCPYCGKKMLHYPGHPHAFGYKSYDVVECRKCRKRMNAYKFKEFIEKQEAEDDHK